MILLLRFPQNGSSFVYAFEFGVGITVGNEVHDVVGLVERSLRERDVQCRRLIKVLQFRQQFDTLLFGLLIEHVIANLVDDEGAAAFERQ